MLYPLYLTFKPKRLAAHLRVIDADGAPVFFLQQQALKVKDAITVYQSETKSKALFEISTDSVLGLNAAYAISDSQGGDVGTLTREGKKSMLRASYAVSGSNGEPAFHVGADSAWAKVLTSFADQLPVAGPIVGGLVKPSYSVSSGGPEGDTALTLTKTGRSKNKYTLEKTGDLEGERETLALISASMALFRELDAA